MFITNIYSYFIALYLNKSFKGHIPELLYDFSTGLGPGLG